MRRSTHRQEAGRSIEKALLLPSKAKWEAALTAALGEAIVMVASHTLAALHIAVFARRPLLPLLSAARTAQALTILTILTILTMLTMLTILTILTMLTMLTIVTALTILTLRLREPLRCRAASATV